MKLLHLDILTVIGLLFVGNLAVVLILIAYKSGTVPRRPYQQFITGRLFQTLAWPLLGLRGEIPDIISASMGNAMLLIGFALESLALTTATDSKRRWEFAYGVFAIVGVAAFLFLADTPNRRVGISTLATLLLFGTASLVMLHTASGSLLRRLLGIFYGLFCLILVFRAGFGFFSNQEFALLTTHPVQSLSFLSLYLLMLVGGTGFLLMLKEQDDLLLSESEEKYRTLIEKAKEGILIAQDGKIVFANQRLSDFLQLPEERFLGMPFVDFIHPADREMVFANYEKRIRGDQIPDSYDFRLIDPHGGPVWVLISAKAITWNGRAATLNMLSDINDRKLMEEEREGLIAELQQALSEVKKLSGLLPICASCKRIRDDKGRWSQVEAYIRKHSEAEFSHGICPECRDKLYPELKNK